MFLVQSCSSHLHLITQFQTSMNDFIYIKRNGKREALDWKSKTNYKIQIMKDAECKSYYEMKELTQDREKWRTIIRLINE